MGFLDKAKALADQAAAKVDEAVTTATSSVSGPTTGTSYSGTSARGAQEADAYFRDLGVLAYLQETSRSPADAEEQRQRCLAAIRAAESQGKVNLTMSSIAPPGPLVPPPPGAAAQAAQAASAVPPPGSVTPPPPGSVGAPPPPGSVAPPPPPGSV